MQIEVSRRLNNAWPLIEDLLWDAWQASQEFDEDIPFNGVFVYAERARRSFQFGGMAFAQTHTVDRRRSVWHPNGAIKLMIGPDIRGCDVVRLMAHELRHIAQFVRGREKHGYLTLKHIGLPEAERDAYGFEDQVVEAIYPSRRSRNAQPALAA